MEHTAEWVLLAIEVYPNCVLLYGLLVLAILESFVACQLGCFKLLLPLGIGLQYASCSKTRLLTLPRKLYLMLAT